MSELRKLREELRVAKARARWLAARADRAVCLAAAMRLRARLVKTSGRACTAPEDSNLRAAARAGSTVWRLAAALLEDAMRPRESDWPVDETPTGGRA